MKAEVLFSQFSRQFSVYKMAAAQARIDTRVGSRDVRWYPLINLGRHSGNVCAVKSMVTKRDRCNHIELDTLLPFSGISNNSSMF